MKKMIYTVLIWGAIVQASSLPEFAKLKEAAYRQELEELEIESQRLSTQIENTMTLSNQLQSSPKEKQIPGCVWQTLTLCLKEQNNALQANQKERATIQEFAESWKSLKERSEIAYYLLEKVSAAITAWSLEHGNNNEGGSSHNGNRSLHQKTSDKNATCYRTALYILLWIVSKQTLKSSVA